MPFAVSFNRSLSAFYDCIVYYKPQSAVKPLVIKALHNIMFKIPL